MYIISGWNNLIDILNVIKKTNFTIINHIIWSFKWGVYAKKKYVSSHYHILFLVKNKKNYIFKPQYINPKNKKGHPYEKDVWNWDNYHRGNDPDHIKGHPCQLPLMLLEKMIIISSNKENWIGDIFSGSGGTLLACKKLERNCISIEKIPDYLKIIKKKAKIINTENKIKNIEEESIEKNIKKPESKIENYWNKKFKR